MTCYCPTRAQFFRLSLRFFQEERETTEKYSTRRCAADVVFHCSNRSSRPRRGLLRPANGTLRVCPSAPHRNPGQTSRLTSLLELHLRSPAGCPRPAG